MDGWEATRRLKADGRVKHIPVIALTAHAMSSDEEKALAAGCDDYLAKPLDEDLLFDKLDQFFA
jgi:CheY-like chemotaxis protein